SRPYCAAGWARTCGGRARSCVKGPPGAACTSRKEITINRRSVGTATARRLTTKENICGAPKGEGGATLAGRTPCQASVGDAVHVLQVPVLHQVVETHAAHVGLDHLDLGVLVD